ncbi:uncharacterized protein [Cherax quadricarinatus]|uniref:uncharacterized protein n=1 Tax=Cherax quadricarinatus TaxID=27406 RepID=UPI00237977DA|nr:uncharacterized protein LOC128704581 [Cherax quadricarinatus]
MMCVRYLILAVSCGLLPPSVNTYSSLNYKFQVDTSLSVFTNCLPRVMQMGNGTQSSPIMYCIILCSADPSCNFVTYDGASCLLHTVVLASGYNVNTSGPSVYPAYRSSGQSIPPVNIATTATVTATTDYPGFPTFASALVQGNIWCWQQVSDCSCTLNKANQVVTINLGSPQYMSQILVYRTVSSYSSLSTSISIYVGNTGSRLTDPLLYQENRPYTSVETTRVYTVGKTAQYITFYRNDGSNLCLCRVLIYD